ncbi:Sodium/hydrogen exchanger family-domain-containing protein [Cyathus striatus]|nr:Sodium/hydrogen exchanger family-domain-containing protein [Cyathus striatus]
MTRFHPFDVTIPHIIYACLGAFVVLFGMFSLFLRSRLYIGEACWAFLFGVIIGPNCANIFNPRAWGDESDEVTNTITLEVTRVVLAIGYMKKHWRSLLFLLGPVMTWGCCLLTPTDPILAAAVVGGKWADKHVPAHLRHLLAAESGCNDGAAFPFLFIALYLTWIRILEALLKIGFAFMALYCIDQVVVGIVIGSILGFSFRHLMKFCTRRDLIDRHSYVAQYVSLAVMTIGVCTLLGSDDLLAAFACGTAFAWDGFFNRQTEESVFSSFQDAALTLSVWRLIVIAILVLLLRRLPVMIALYRWIPDVKTFREAVFSGHFGPIGVGAVFISTLAGEVIHKSGQSATNPQTELLENTIEPIVAFMVLCSIIVHGLSIPSFSLGRRVHSVSRTWSRREVSLVDGQPEWANQTRRVTRAEDVVVNRDSGFGSGEKVERPGSDVEEKTPVSESSDETRVAALAHAHGERRGNREDAREENLPDGEEGDVLQEWYEGHHKITERRRGPGEDVEVIVTSLVDGERPPRDEEEGGGGPPTDLRGHMAEEREKWRNAAHHAQDDIRHGAHIAEERLAHAEKRLRMRLVPVLESREGRETPSAVVSDDGEEGWASEGSSGGEPSSSHLPQTRKPRQFEVRAPRRKNSSRRGSISSYLREGEDDSARGRAEASRASTAGTAGAAAGTPYTYPYQSRAGRSSRPGTSDSCSLRGSRVNVGREASPARSVRFADEGRGSRGSVERGSGSGDYRAAGRRAGRERERIVGTRPLGDTPSASRSGTGSTSVGEDKT